MSELKTYEVIGNITHDGEEITDGEIELTEKQARELLRLKKITLPEDETVDEAALLLKACYAAYEEDSDKKPSCTDLKKDLGFTVSADDRDTAWEAVLEEKTAPTE